jgi:ribosomal protein S18 acetylase RimI-like enzyme
VFSVRPVRPQDLPAAVTIFLECFADNVRGLYAGVPRPDATLDVWRCVRDAEPDGFLGAYVGDRLVGYAIVTRSVSSIRRYALLHGHVLHWAWRAIRGAYGLRGAALARTAWNKLLFVRFGRRFRSRGDAQVLNVAVSEAWRGRGIAKALLREALTYLAAAGVGEVRLEVRPDNEAALAVYRSCGFTERGSVRDAGGEWIVMTARV